ncbi:MAG: J domain-containing protein [Chloroflexota bacterium]
MARTFCEWLKYNFDKVLNVQTSSLNSPASDLAIYCWSGVKIHVHLIDQPTSPRAIKRILQEDTQVGISSMFLVDVQILPEDGARTNPTDWMTALHTLNSNRIYAYRVIDNQPEIIQVHLEDIPGKSSEQKVWYGPAIGFDDLRYLRKSTKLRSIKGDWLIADFGTMAFWKNTDYRADRARRERANSTDHTFWQTWSAYQTWGGPYETDESNGSARRHATSQTPMGDYLTNCYKMLGVEQSATREEVKRAYRKRALAYHPDTSELPSDEAAAKFKALNAAYDFIKSANGWS